MEKKPTIAVLMGNTQTEYSTALIDGFYTCASRENVNLIFLFRAGSPFHNKSDNLGENEVDYNIQFGSIYDYVPDVHPDALIVAYGSMCVRPDVPDKKLLIQRYGNIPILMFEDVSNDPNVPYLNAENYKGTYALVEHLVKDHGYRKLAFMAGPPKNHDSNERKKAFIDCLQKYGIPFEDHMVVYGDFSEFIDDRVEKLLELNPGVEALVFANDNMAKSGYRVCIRHGMTVGKDIAIVGFDDVNISKNMAPPMTTVGHSSFMYSYLALQKAIKLCRGEKVENETLDAVPIFRQSCGCDPARTRKIEGNMDPVGIHRYVGERTVQICKELFASVPYEQEEVEYLKHMQEFFSILYDEIFSRKTGGFPMDGLDICLNYLCKNRHVSVRFMTERVTELLKELMPFAPNEEAKVYIQDAIEFILKYVHSLDLIQNQALSHKLEYESWFMATFMSDLITENHRAEDNMHNILEHLRRMGIASAYIFLYEQPVKKRGWVKLGDDDTLYLAGYYNEEKMMSAEHLSIPVVPEEGGIVKFLPTEDGRHYVSFVLFSGEEHYGIMICELEQEDIFFVLSVSMQMGSLFQVMRLIEAEYKATKSLKESMELIQEQNSILSVISTNDELTKLLNRRGFMEAAIKAMKERSGEKAYLFFSDLDHLKEINDCFGHKAGDFAICTAADYLRESLPQDAIIARFGGDEFVALVITEEPNYEKTAALALRDSADVFNHESREDYYIELSSGIYAFTAGEDREIAELLQHSDEVLYKEKKKRRSTVKKPINRT